MATNINYSRRSRSPVTGHEVSSQTMSGLHSPYHHPSPLHSGSVHITEFPDITNPQPWEAEFETRSLGMSRDYLSPRKLVEITGEKDLTKVKYLDLSFNSYENSLGNLGSSLPNLTQLRITSGVVPCIRDLGTSLAHVTILWMPRCKLKDLDGLPALSCLKELYIAFNEISDVCLVTMLSSLEILDVESNDLTDLSQIGYLSLCPALSVLTLEGNPLCALLAGEQGSSEEGYRSAIFKTIHSLKILDDLPQHEALVTTSKTSELKEDLLTSRSSVFVLSETGLKKDWQMVLAGIKNQEEERGEEMEREMRSVVQPYIRPSTAPARRTPNRQVTSPQHLLFEEDDSSELTYGLDQVICGNPVRALRQRKKQSLVSQSTISFSRDSDILPTLHNWRLDSISESSMNETLTYTEPDPTQSKLQPDHFTKTTPHRLPTPPKATPHNQPLPPRPQTVADFRQRRYRKPSTDICLSQGHEDGSTHQ